MLVLSNFFQTVRSQPLPKPKRNAQKPPKAAGSARRSSTHQPVTKGAYAEPELGDQDVLRAAPMRRLIRDILGDIKAELHPELYGGGENPRAADRVTGEALDIICRAAEDHIEELFRLGYFATRHTGRTTIKPEVTSRNAPLKAIYSKPYFRLSLSLFLS